MKITFVKYPLSRRQWEVSPFRLWLDPCPALNYGAAQLSDAKGSERSPPHPENPLLRKPGRFISSLKQVHQKQVLGIAPVQKWRNNYLEMLLSVSYKHLLITLCVLQT